MSEPHHQLDFHDKFCLLKMDCLTFAAKRILPRGFWGRAAAAQEDTERHLYLTFDDGPHPETTSSLLDLLDQEQITATFFVMGKRVERYPDLVADIHKRGHAVGNHTYSHLFLPTLPTSRMQHEIEKTSQVIREMTGVAPTLFRPPFGLLDERGAAISRSGGMQTIYWGAVS